MDEAIKTAVTSLATELKGDVTEIFPIMLGVTGAVIAAGFVRPRGPPGAPAPGPAPARAPRRQRTGADGLLIKKTRLPKMHMHINETG